MDDTTALETETEDTRDRIATAIDGLQDCLSPTAIVDRTIEQITSTGSEAVASVKQSFVAHPAMFAASGAAIGLAVLLRGRASAKKPLEHDLSSDVQHTPALTQRPGQQLAAGRGREPLLGAVFSAVAGAVLAQILPVSAAKRQLLDTSDHTLATVAASLHHRL